MIEALLEATRDRIRDQLKIDGKKVGVRPKGKPPATMGDFYIAVDEIGVQSGDAGSLREGHQIAVWITIRAAVLPEDRREDGYLARGRNLTALERKVIKAVHGNHDLRTAANVLLQKYEALGSAEFQAPLYYSGRGATSEPKTDWIVGESPEQPTPCLVRQLNFAGGLRVQRIDEIE